MAVTNFSDLFTALFNCFTIIIFGYVAGRLKLITSTQTDGIGTFVGTFALPALLFKSMVELNFNTVSWNFLVSILLAKSGVFFLVLLITLVILRSKGLGQAALFAIFATQSNDFALGYPIVKVLYGTTHREFLQYIYLLAPISLLILNPIGFTLLEVDKARRLKNENEANRDKEIESDRMPCENCPNAGSNSVEFCINNNEAAKTASSAGHMWWKVLLKIVKNLVSNPIVLMVFVGLIFHFIFNSKIPALLAPLLKTLSNAFSACALFYLGLGMVGKIANQGGMKMAVPVLLIIAKILLLPILAREFVIILNSVLPVADPYRTGNLTATSPDEYASLNLSSQSKNMSYVSALANYAFLYGTFPTAPTVVLYAARYGLEVDRLATGMVICTTLSAPIMYVSAWVLTISTMDYSYFENKVELVDKDISIIGSVCAVWCIVLFVCSKKFQQMPHLMTLLLAISMFVSAIVVVISDFSITTYTSTASKYFAFAIFFFGVTAARLYTASLAMSLATVHYYGEQKAWDYKLFFIAVPAVFAIVLLIIVMTTGNMNSHFLNNIFLFGNVQDIVSFSVILFSLITTTVCLLLLFRLPNFFEEKIKKESNMYTKLDNTSETSLQENVSLSEEELLNLTESLSTVVEEEADTRKWFMHFPTKPATGRHIILLLLLGLSQFIGLVLTGWRITTTDLSGIYFEFAFLDSVFNFGQAFFVFLLFGLDDELIIEPIVGLWHRLTKGDSEITLTPLVEVHQDILKKCSTFAKHHLEKCEKDLLCTKRCGLQSYSNVLLGSDLCCWLVEFGLASDRQSAVLYGEDLMQGRLLKHISNKHHFYDKNYLYKFESPSNRSVSQNAEEEALCSRGTCVLQSKSYTFESYLHEPVQLITTSIPNYRVTRHDHQQQQANHSEPLITNQGASGSVMSDVAVSAASLLELVEKPNENHQQTVEVLMHCKRDLIDW